MTRVRRGRRVVGLGVVCVVRVPGTAVCLPVCICASKDVHLPLLLLSEPVIAPNVCCTASCPLNCPTVLVQLVHLVGVYDIYHFFFTKTCRQYPLQICSIFNMTTTILSPKGRGIFLTACLHFRATHALRAPIGGK